MALQLGWALPGQAQQATYYGAPYNVDSPVGVGAFSTLGGAAQFFISQSSKYCQTGDPCTFRVAYSDPKKNGSIAAYVYFNNSTDPATQITASEHIDNPLKSAGGINTCKAGTGGNGGGSSPWGSSGDSARESSGGCSSTSMAGDPINTATGNKFQQETDFYSSDWLTFRRFYNSTAQIAAASMGARWRHSFDRSLEILQSTPGLANGTSFIFLNRPDGSREQFKPANGVWVTDADTPDTLVEKDDASGHAVSYAVFIAVLHQTETYDANGLLQTITDATGQSVTLTYSTALTPITVAPKPNLLLTVTDPSGRALSFTYDSNARVQAIALPDGGILTYGYDAISNLTSVTYPDTHSRQYVYNESSFTDGISRPNALTGVIDEKKVRFESTTYNYYGQASVSSAAMGVDATTINYYYDYNGSVTTSLGAATHLTLIDNGFGSLKVGSSSQPCGLQCNQPWASRTYDANGYPASATDFNGNVTSTTYNSVGLLTQRIEAKGTAAQRTITTIWDNVLRNPLTRSVLDANGKLVTQSAWVYNTRGQVLASCDIDPGVTGATSYICATTGTAPVGVRRSMSTYCDAVDSVQCPLIGLMLSKDGPRTDVAGITRFSYYLTTDESGCGIAGGSCHRVGDLYQVTDAIGHVSTVVAYDKNGRVARRRNVNGTITDLTYSPRGWLLTKIIRANTDGTPSPQDAVTAIAYDPVGTVHQVTDPDGVVVTYTYDDAHRLTDITDAQGNHIHYTLDAAGNRVKEQTFDTSNTVRSSLTRKYNTLGQLTNVIDGLSNTVYNASYSDSYDTNGNLVHTADALNVQRKNGYDGLNRLISTLDNYNGSDTSTKNTSSVLTYDALDRLEGMTDPDGLSTTYDYDGLSNVTAIHSPDTGTAPSTYDAAGNITQWTDAKGIVRTYAYDVLNRVVSVSYPDTTLNVTYAYDEANAITGCGNSYATSRLTRVIESAVTTVFCYDARGNVTQKRQIQGSQIDTTSYAYTLANRISSVTSPSLTTTQYSRNALGLISGVSVTPAGGAGQTVVSAISYLPFGPIASYTFGNGQTMTRTYDANYEVTDLASPALNLHFVRDAMGNIKTLGNAPGASPAIETYSYDPLYRLGAVNSPSGTAIEAYSYSKGGDRLSKTGSGLATGTYGYQSGTHWLNSIGNTARTYDVNGNTIGSAAGGNTLGLGYNGRNRLSLLQRNAQTVGTYTYNAFGQRIAKAITFPQVASERFAHDRGGRLLGEYGTTNRDYIWLNGLLIAVVDVAESTRALNYVHVDGLGTPRAITNSSGNTIWQWSYAGNPFGEQPPTSTSGYIFNLRFPGQYYDAESGLIHNGMRTYCAECGRYIQSDPMGLGGGLSTYAYAGNSPLQSVDPTGLMGIEPLPPEVEARIESTPETLAEVESLDADAMERAREERNEREFDRVQAEGGRHIPISEFGEFGGCKPPGADESVGPTGGANLQLRYRLDWSQSQREEAARKVQVLNDSETVVTEVNRSGTSASSRYRQSGGYVPPGNDVDHTIDLQLGGRDDPSNMAPLNSSVNRSLGSQISWQIRYLPPGTVVHNVTIGD